MCHGARGLSQADTPNLAGEYPITIYKELVDFKTGRAHQPLAVLRLTITSKVVGCWPSRSARNAEKRAETADVLLAH